MFKILLLFLKNINSYGIFVSIKIFIFEMLALINLDNFSDLSYNESNSSYEDSKKKKKYDVPYIPTPFYFLYLINKYLKKLNLKTIIFFDLGCGLCRPVNYLKDKINLTFIGVEIDKRIYDKININKNQKYKIYNTSLRNLIEIKKIIKNNLSKKYVNIFFVSDTAEINLFNKIYRELDPNKKIVLIFVNSNFHKFKNKNFNVKKKIFFKDKSRNIIFLKNF